MGTVDTFIGNNLIIDWNIFTLWVKGFSVDECKFNLIKRDADNKNIKETIIHNDILDHYLLFNKLELYLQTPYRLKEQLLFQITNDILNKLIEIYYEYNASVMRELLGHKLTQRQRKDLDEISEKTGVRIKSCRRQFDNLKRISRTVEDMRGSLTKNISEVFLLPAKMTEQYAAMVFITNNHFDISRKKLNYLTLDDLIYCANQMLKNWSEHCQTSSECDISKDFLVDLKELKVFIERDYMDDHRRLVALSIRNKNPQFYQSIDPNFKELSRGLIEIAVSLNHRNDMKDLFLDLVEQFIEPCKENYWNKNEVKIFLDEYKDCASQLDGEITKDLLEIFDRYIITLQNIIIQIYHS